MVEKQEQIKGIWYTIAAFLFWGILPLYWKAVKTVPPSQILAHRITWSSIFVFIILLIQGRVPEIRSAFSLNKTDSFLF